MRLHVRFNVGRSVADTLRVVQAICTGQMCPAEWKPGMEFGPSDQQVLNDVTR